VPGWGVILVLVVLVMNKSGVDVGRKEYLSLRCETLM